MIAPTTLESYSEILDACPETAISLLLSWLNWFLFFPEASRVSQSPGFRCLSRDDQFLITFLIKLVQFLAICLWSQIPRFWMPFLKWLYPYYSSHYIQSFPPYASTTPKADSLGINWPSGHIVTLSIRIPLCLECETVRNLRRTIRKIY